MSTTLAVLHVLVSGDRDSLLMTSSTPSSLMTSRPTSSLVASLDPVLVEFWSGFPCPPPWNEALLFKVNWTSCVSQTVGERIRWFLADRCNIPHNGTFPDPGGGGGGGGAGGGGGGGGGSGEGEGGFGEKEEVCDMACKLLVGLFCLLFVVGVVIGGACLLHRRRSQKRKDPRGAPQQTTGSGADRGRAQYAGIHYASASVITREGERPLPPCPEGVEGGGGGGGPSSSSSHPALPRQLHSYTYNPRHHHHHHHQHGPGDRGHDDPQTFHLHLCPLSRRAAYRAMEPGQDQHPTSAVGVGEPPHHYDYISDTDSLRYRGSGSVHDYTYCTCDHSEGGGSSVAAECDNNSTTTSATPRQSEGYYSDHDLAGSSSNSKQQQHEISKPHPKYPEKAVSGKPFGGGGLNNNDHEACAMLRGGCRDGDGDGGGRGGEEGFVPGVHGLHGQIPGVDGRHCPVVPVLPPSEGGGGYPPGLLPPTDPALGGVPAVPRYHGRHYPAVLPAGHGVFVADLPVTTTTTSTPQSTGSVPRSQAPPPPPPSHPPPAGVPVQDPPHRLAPAGFPLDRTRIPLHSVNSYEVPVDGIPPTTDRTRIPLHSMNSYETPVSRHGAHMLPPSSFNNGLTRGGGGDGGGGGGDGGSRGGGGTLRFVNAPQEDSSAVSSGPHPHHHDHLHHHQHPTLPVDPAAPRANALAVHPQYFTEYFDASTSSV
ncbi:uncharacterized protein LOC143281422 [Babylonia areolata]|uniref:uncharacterized protein LOC143281422 n=1 Tax=Babylonia areolata TaxID=304850 RepID=UPI003FD22E1A